MLAFLLISCAVLAVCLHTAEAQGGLRWGREFEANQKFRNMFRNNVQRRTYDDENRKGITTKCLGVSLTLHFVGDCENWREIF